MRLERAPLVEALVEIRWKLQPSGGELGIDPHYRLLLGRLSDKVAAKYPAYERLPVASVPEELAAYLVQHRFRYGQGDYPLIQVGPGIMTFNETSKYEPSDFSERVVEAIRLLYDAHPASSELEMESIQLRYINAEEFDYEQNNAIEFLREKMGVEFSLPPRMFADFGVKSSPRGLSWHSAFRSSSPPGDVILRIATGEREGHRSLIWETMMVSAGTEVPPMSAGFNQWFHDAHRIADGWFWTLVSGELERKYRDG